ncbi:EAL domain-containing protein [Thermithiobacillus tepidarius DSM 3134]|uniref:EAL domain-containing protein n=1 Tax=Thermithiobacillus tepidarius TaxID=929 RepID=UPI00042A55C5|nr:EAL domain-containing protein [Thermithiobacillus tepidarius]
MVTNIHKNPRIQLHSHRLIATGFTLVLLLMGTLTLVALYHLADLQKRLDTVVNEQNVKTDLISTMRLAARERAMALYRMSLTPDPFARDEEFLRFNQLAGDFAAARMRLLDMALSPAERAILEQQGRLSRMNRPLQDEVANLMLTGNTERAGQILLDRVIPLQNEVLAALDRLRALQTEAARQAAAEAGNAYRAAQLAMAGLGSTALGLGILIAVYVARRTASAEEALFQEKELAEVTLHSIGDAVITTDAGGRVDYLNPVAEQLTGWTAQEARQQPLETVFRLIDGTSRESIDHPASHNPLDGQTLGLNHHTLLVRRDGQEFAITHSAAPIRNRAGESIGAVIAFHDVTEAKRLARQLSWQASHDALTGLANRREFERRLAELLEDARQRKQMHILLYLDLDQFKVVNDTCGHMAGDELLRQLATLIQARVRGRDTVARLGGDEFALLLESCALEHAFAIAEKLRHDIGDFRFAWEDKIFSCGVSIGLVPITPHSESLAALLSAADTACYAAKENGRHRIHVYRPDDSELARREGEMQWVFQINRAIEDGLLRLYYQPIVPAAPDDSRPGHFEILLRMVDGTGETIPPMAFIPAAERYNLMATLDRWVVQNTFEWIARQDLSAQGNLDCCAINLSAHSLCDPDFLDFVINQFQRTSIRPEQICFEITESCAIANLSRARQLMSALWSMGCRFALDDFGSGMSSFAYLKNLPVDFLKIDGAFVRDMVDDPVDHAMVEAITRIGHVMGIQIIAEFVENEAIREKLRHLGVDYVQGYAIDQARPLAQFRMPAAQGEPGGRRTQADRPLAASCPGTP